LLSDETKLLFGIWKSIMSSQEEEKKQRQAEKRKGSEKEKEKENQNTMSTNRGSPPKRRKSTGNY
jgi:hypothetical protein